MITRAVALYLSDGLREPTPFLACMMGKLLTASSYATWQAYACAVIVHLCICASLYSDATAVFEAVLERAAGDFKDESAFSGAIK